MPNIRIILLSSLVLAIMAYLALLIAGAGTRMDAFADLGEKQNTFTLYYMNGCPHCESILPAYKKFAAAGQVELNGKKVAIRMIEQADASAAAEMNELKITGFPTFYLKTSNDKQIEYKGDRTVSAMSDFISKNAI